MPSMTPQGDFMPCIRRSAVSLAVSATLALGLCPTALAQPVPPSAPPATTQAEQPPDGWDIDTLSKGRKAEIALARRMATHAVNWKKRTWNYALADKYDKGKAATRRKAAAGWLVGGGKVTHISKSELEKVRVYQRRLAAPPARPCRHSPRRDAPDATTGRSRPWSSPG
jgi:hypothetical protein